MSHRHEEAEQIAAADVRGHHGILDSTVPQPSNAAELFRSALKASEPRRWQVPEEIDLSPEDEQALDRAWASLQEQARLEELGQGPPRWGLDRARHERPGLSSADADEWVRVANAEYRRLRMDRVAQSVADRQSLQVANERFPAG
jgi:hypothetical protein